MRQRTTIATTRLPVKSALKQTRLFHYAYKGALAEVRPDTLAAHVIAALVERAGIATSASCVTARKPSRRFGHRWAIEPTCRLPGQHTLAQTSGRTVWLRQKDRADAASHSVRTGQGSRPVPAHDDRLEPGPYEEPPGVIRLEAGHGPQTPKTCVKNDQKLW
jgi:hypothetical protein